MSHNLIEKKVPTPNGWTEGILWTLYTNVLGHYETETPGLFKGVSKNEYLSTR